METLLDNIDLILIYILIYILHGQTGLFCTAGAVRGAALVNARCALAERVQLSYPGQMSREFMV